MRFGKYQHGKMHLGHHGWDNFPPLIQFVVIRCYLLVSARQAVDIAGKASLSF
jgi:hypothetical protein